MLGARGEGGFTYARKLDIARSACSEAREAVLKAVEKSNSDRRPKTPPEVEVVLSPEEALAKAEQEKKERQERREKSYYWRFRKKLHDAWKARDEKDEAELELELMRIGVETRGDRPKDWSLISQKVVETLRVSADHETKIEGLHGVGGEIRVERGQCLCGLRSVDGVVHLFVVGFEGCCRCGLGAENGAASSRSEAATTSSQIAAPKGLLKLAANAPLLTVDSLRTMQLFWMSCIFCCAVPIYLMPAIRQAREQTLG